MPNGDETLATLRFLLERSHGQWNERRKYEWFAFGQFLVVLAAIGGAITQVPGTLNEFQKCLLVIFVVLVGFSAAAIVWFLIGVQRRNSADDPRVRALNNELVRRADIDDTLRSTLRRENEYGWWSLGPQVVFVLLATAALLLLLWVKASGG